VIAWSSDPDRAWAERFFLAISPLWMIAVATVIIANLLPGWGAGAYLAFACVLAAPAAVGPLVARRSIWAGGLRRPAYWLKFNVWIAIVVVFGTYIGTAYFVDLMGMRYGFPSALHLESPIVGRSGAPVPLFLYPLTQAYFVTYFTGLGVAWRTIRVKLRLGRLGALVSLVILAYLLAFGETFAMATDALTGLFAYADRTKMLLVGSLGYAIYFFVGLPMLERIEPTWTLGRTVIEALATCMAILVLLELWAQLVGPL
jgi:cycloeucalenol cycloisomerase